MLQSIGIGFIVSAIICTFVDQSFRSFGINVCERFDNLSQAYDICYYAVKKDASSGFLWNWGFLWFLSSIVVKAITKGK
jgi:hypothetical protein